MAWRRVPGYSDSALLNATSQLRLRADWESHSVARDQLLRRGGDRTSPVGRSRRSSSRLRWFCCDYGLRFGCWWCVPRPVFGGRSSAPSRRRRQSSRSMILRRVRHDLLLVLDVAVEQRIGSYASSSPNLSAVCADRTLHRRQSGRRRREVCLDILIELVLVDRHVGSPLRLADLGVVVGFLIKPTNKKQNPISRLTLMLGELRPGTCGEYHTQLTTRLSKLFTLRQKPASKDEKRSSELKVTCVSCH